MGVVYWACVVVCTVCFIANIFLIVVQWSIATFINLSITTRYAVFSDFMIFVDRYLDMHICERHWFQVPGGHSWSIPTSKKFGYFGVFCYPYECFIFCSTLKCGVTANRFQSPSCAITRKFIIIWKVYFLLIFFTDLSFRDNWCVWVCVC